MKLEPPRGAMTERHQDRMTLTHAIARLTYGSAIGHRYNVDSDGFYMSEGEARRLRSRNLIGHPLAAFRAPNIYGCQRARR